MKSTLTCEVDPDIQQLIEAKLAKMQERLEEEQEKRADEVAELKKRLEAPLFEKWLQLHHLLFPY